MKSEAEIYEAVARGWCHDANSAKEMDVLLGEAIAIEVLKVIRPLVAERDALKQELDLSVKLREAADARIKELEAAIQRACDDDICPWARCQEDCPLYPYRGGE